MGEEFFKDTRSKFLTLTSNALPFLEGSSDTSENFLELCKLIYDFSKDNGLPNIKDPIPKLIIEGFDNEQVWQEIELFNKSEASVSLKCTEELILKKRSVNLIKRAVSTIHQPCSDEVLAVEADCEEDEFVDGNMESLHSNDGSDEESGFHFEEEVDPESEEDENIDDYCERSEVDDDFFSLRKMEKFLEEQDRLFENENLKPPGGEIDYFDEMCSTEEDEDEMEDCNESSSKSARHLKYSEYFDSPTNRNEQVGDKSENTDNSDEKVLSSHERHQWQIRKKIEILENKSLEPAQWQMRGEIKATNRPENSLLQEMLTFDNIAQPPIEITEEHTTDMESLIRQRILDSAWDDVKRTVKPTGDPAEFKKRIVLDSSQSKLSLSAIYEKEYMEKNQSGKKEYADGEEEESKANEEIRKELKDLFRKLDALSNFHFIAPPPEPEIKVISNLPSVTMEEVQPVAHSEGQVLAPEEIFEKSAAGEEKSTKEMSSTDLKRERRKKKLRMKTHSNARLAKLKELDPNSAAYKKSQAIAQLKNAAKAPSGNTTILKASRSSEKLTSSQKFFSKLQDRKTSLPKTRKIQK